MAKYSLRQVQFEKVDLLNYFLNFLLPYLFLIYLVLRDTEKT